MAKPVQAGVIPIGNWNSSGLAFSKWSGLKDSFYKMVGLDPHSFPGVLNVEQKLTAETTGTEPTEFCRVGVSASNSIRYWFSYTSGKIWQEKAGTYTLVYTTSPAAGTAGCLGAEEYQGYLYWATQSRLHRIAVASADGSANWTANAVPNWGTFGVTDAEFHPMLNHNGQQILYIGDGNRLAQVDAGVFSANALDIVTPLRIKCLGKIGTDILLGTYVASTVTKTEIIRWNGWSVSFTNSDSIPETGINAFLPADNMVLVQAGRAGNIYYYDGTNLELYTKIPGDYSSTKYGEVYPNSVANNAGQILFGFSNSSGNPVDQGIYRIAKHNRNFSYITDLAYPISERSGTDFVLTGVEIGAILVVSGLVYASWKHTVGETITFGVDKLDINNKLDGAYFETRVCTINREQFSNLSKIVISYTNLPTGTDINMYLSRNYASYGSALSKVNDTDRKVIESINSSDDFTALQLRVKVTTSSNDSPTIESGGIFLH